MRRRVIRQRGRRHAMVLLSVILVITMAALAGTTAMYLAQAQMAGTRTMMKRTQGRALAWSGVQAAMAELADQREKLLEGGTPELTAEWEVFADEGRGRGVVRLQAWFEEGPIVESEAGKIDLNSASVEMLKAAGLDEKSAGAIVAARQGHPFLSERDVLRVAGVTLGSSAPGQPAAGRNGGSRDDAAARFLRQCTVFAFDPNIQCGLGTNGSDHRGKRRVNLNTPWSDRLAAAVDERFGEGASKALKGFFDKGTKFKTLADVVRATRTSITDPKAWPPVFDALTVSDDPYLLGRIDLNRASAETLACVPGISKEAAAKIVEIRDKLDSESRQTIVWPVAQGILKQEEFERAADWLTTRSMQWRVRVEGGLASAEPGVALGALSDRVVLEAVIDVASERPRVAYLRDVTIEDVVEQIATAERVEDVERETPAAEPEASPAPPAAPAADSHDLKLDTDLDLSSSMDKGFGDLHLSGQAQKPPESGAPGATGATGPSPPAPPDAPPSEGVDRRIGRWTAGKSGKGVPS